MSLVTTEIADMYQEFFNFMNQKHNLILTISEMDEILHKSEILIEKFNQKQKSHADKQKATRNKNKH